MLRSARYSDSRYVLEGPSPMTAPDRLTGLAAAILCVTRRIGHVHSFVASLPVSSHAAPFSSYARKTASSFLVRPVCRSSETDTTQDGTADGTWRQPDRVQQPLPLSSSTAMPKPRSRAAARDRNDVGSNHDRELTLGRRIMLTCLPQVHLERGMLAVVRRTSSQCTPVRTWYLLESWATVVVS